MERPVALCGVGAVGNPVRETSERGDDSPSNNFLYLRFPPEFTKSVSTAMGSPPTSDTARGSLP